MKRLNINVTDEQNDRLDYMSEVMGVTKNGLICYAIHEWLVRNDTGRTIKKKDCAMGE